MKILCVGKQKEQYLREGCDKYVQQINYYDKITVNEIKDSDVKREGKELLEKINEEWVIVLSEEGKQYGSVEFSQMLCKINKEVLFVIGSSEGIAPEVKQRANMILSLSKMTFLHEMARLILLEQIYRHEMIKQGKTYHK